MILELLIFIAGVCVGIYVNRHVDSKNVLKDNPNPTSFIIGIEKEKPDTINTATSTSGQLQDVPTDFDRELMDRFAGKVKDGSLDKLLD